ncbi:uncharacterized protein LOC123525510 [Mercenaria mercenaria]|uniref:uncharacterized protein LOC123525510 n=1 Tax=Mercenaria mercenaria TaxID=6596 RepID=UPI00234F4898|nr:uncharacterized protein LOC123525510 [Mercenaria mercenaria]
MTPTKNSPLTDQLINPNGDIDTSLTISLPNRPAIELSASRQKEGPSVNSVISLKYEDSKAIRLDSLHRTGAVKQLKLKFTSPFTSEYSAEGVFQASRNSIRANANIEAEPLLSRWSVTASLDRTNGISGNLKVNTPYPAVSYSQISILSEIVDGSRQSSVVAEYVPGRIVKLTSMYLFKSNKDMQVSLELSTPFEIISHASTAFRHQGGLSAFSNYGEVEYKSEKISVESKFSMTNGIQSSIHIKSPYTQDVSGSIRHDGTMNNFASHGEVTWGKTVSADLKHEGSYKRFSSSAKVSSDSSSYSGNINFNLGPKMSTEISIETPIEKFENVRISHAFEGHFSKFTNHAEISSSGFGTISSDVNSVFENSISLTVSAQTPFTNFRDMKAVFTHEGSLSRFTTHVEFQNGLSKYSGDMKLNTEQAVSFETIFRTPFKNFKMTRLSLTSEGSLNNFKLHVETQLNKDTSEVDLVCNTQRKYDIDLTIRSPYTNTIKASLDHWGNWKKFQSKLNIRSGKDKLLSSIKFAIRPTFNTMISIKSPFAYLKNQQLSLKHAGSLNSFKCNMQYNCNGKTYVGDASFQNLNALKAELNLKGPTFRPINVAVSHDGTLSNFKSAAAMSMGKKSIQADANLNMVKGIKGSIGLLTPFEGFESMNAAISHAGELNNFKSHGEIKYNLKSGQVDVTLDATRDVSATITITTPFEGYRDVTSTLKHTGTIDNFNTLATFSRAGKSIEGQASFQTSPVLSGSASVKSSFASVGNYDMSFNHEGTLSKFSTNGELNIGNKRSTAEVAFDSTNGYEGRVSIDSPLMKKTEVQIKHTSTDNSLNTNAFLAQNNVKQYSIQSDLSRKPMSGIVTITTPHEGYESTELSLHHDGTANDFRSSVSLDILGGRYESEILFAPLPDMQVSLALRSPLSKDIEASISYQGKPTNFNSRFNYLFGRESKMLIETNLNADGPYSGNMKIISPLMKNIKASFSHDGGLNNFKSKAEVTYAGKSTEARISLQINPDIETTMHFTSPLTEDLDINFAHNGPWTNCKSNGAITYGGQKHLDIDGQFNFDSNLNGELKISTSAPGFSTMSTKVSHEGDLSGFQCHGEFALEDKAVIGDIKYRPTEGSVKISTPFHTDFDGSYKYSPNEGSISLSTPFMKNVQGNYKVKDSLHNSLSDVALSYGPTKLLGIRGNMDYPKSGEISFETPIQGYENTRIALTRRGDMGGNAEFELNGKTHQADLSINSNERKMSASASVNSPVLPKMSSDMSFSGTVSNFQSHIDVVFKIDKHAIDSQFSMGRKIEGSMLVKSSLIPELSVNFDTNKDLSNLISSADISFDSKKIFNMRSTLENANRKAVNIDVVIPDNSFNFASTLDGILTDFNGHVETTVNSVKTEADASFSLKPVSVSVSLKSPWTGPVSSAFNLNGNIADFKGHGEFSYNNIKNEGDISFGMSPLRSDITIKSPVKDVTVSFAHDGNFRNFRTQADVSIDDQKLDAELIFNIETAIEGSASLNMPNMKPMKASFEHTNTLNTLRNLMSMEYGENTLASSELTLSFNPVKATVSIKTPFDGYKTVSALFSHTGGMLDFDNHAEIVIQGRKSQADMTFNFGSKLEGRISASSPFFPSSGLGFNLSGNLAKFSTDADLTFGDNKYSVDASIDSRVGIDASVTVNTPIKGYKTVSAKLSHTGQYPRMNSFAQVKTGSRNLLTGSAQMDNTDGISGKLSLQSIMTPTFQANMEHTGSLSDFNTNAELRINGKPISAIVGLKTTPSVSGILSLTSPFARPVSGSFELKSLKKEISLHAEGNLDSKSVVCDASVDYGNTIGANVAIKTPFTGFEKMKGSIKYIKEYKGFTSNADIEFSGKKIEAEAKSSWRQAVTGSLSIRTPYETLRSSSAEFTIDGTFPKIQTEMSVLHSEQKYYLSGKIDNGNGQLMINTPFTGFEALKSSFSYEGTKENMHTEARINYMTGEDIFVSFQNVQTSESLQTKARIETPYIEDISFDLNFNGQLTDFSNTLTITMGEANVATSTTTFKLQGTSLDLDTSLRSTFSGYSDEQKLSVSYEGLLPNMKASANAKLLGSYFSFDTSLQVDDTINGMIALKTPFANLKDVAFNFDHAGSSRRFTTKSEVQYDTNKKIEGTLQYVKYGWRRLQTSLDVRTPFAGFEISKASYRHTASVDSFESDADVSFMNKDFSGNIRASMTPLSASISATTPFDGFEQIGADSKLTYSTGTFNAEANVQYMQGKTISLSSSADIISTPKSANIKLTTPFQGFENSEIILSTSGDLSNFQSTMAVSSPFTPALRARANMRYTSLKNMEGSVTFSSQIKNFENLRFTLKNEANRAKYDSKIEMSWAPAKSITFDGSFTDKRYEMSADMTLSTPFQAMRQLNLKSETTNQWLISQKLYGKYNGKVFADLDLSANYGNKKSASLLMRSPRTLLVELEGSVESKYEAALTVSSDITNVNNGVKINGVFDPRTNALSIKYTCPMNTISLDGTFDKSNTKFDMIMNGNRYGYDMAITGTDGQIKFILPSRSLKVSGSQSAGATEGSFMWDADKDETRKIGFRSILRPTSDSVKADITLMMPSIGKEVQIDSQMSLNKGRILFDGKTELTYSRDSRKKFTIMSRLEDVSNSWSAKNYSFTFGISHPYTSVDVQVSSQFGNSNQKITGGINMNYLTVKRDVKTFSVNGEIDKARNAFSLDMDTPMKKIGINGNAQTVSPYRLSLTNKYDAKRPLNTVFSFDPSKRSIDFQMNYDLDNPSSELHLSAKYVNSSAVAAEMFHVVNRQRVTDVLLALRLNTSSLLHSHIHWRPDMINDLKALSDRKMNTYERRLRNFADVALNHMTSELEQKTQLIGNSFAEEVEPVAAIAEENLETLSKMYETNEYYIRDITDAVVLNLAQMEELSEEYINLLRAKIEERLAHCLGNCRETLQDTLTKVEEATGYIALKTVYFYRKYTDHAYNISKPVIETVNDKYKSYVQYMNQLNTSPLSNMADAYTSAIYGTRDVISTRLSPLMDRNDVRYVKSISDRVYQEGQNAYKYWEIRENTEMVGKAVADWIREEIEKEISDIRATVMNLLKSKVTVYDLKNGEIQMEFHLPVPLKSLDVIPKVDFMPYVVKAKSYIPNMPSLSMPSTDVTTWLPPFDAMATVEGNKITTFDGLTYDMDSSCTFMLARDYVNSNFSVILNRDGNNKTMVIVKGQTSIKMFSNGKVAVNNMPVELPAILKDVTVTSLDGHVTVNVAGHLNIDYYKDLDTYMVKLNGYYYGKTKGLLGSYDNEPSNDMMTSFGKVTSSTERFAKTWDVGTERCR